MGNLVIDTAKKLYQFSKIICAHLQNLRQIPGVFNFGNSGDYGNFGNQITHLPTYPITQ
jgi:hypothetical protein